MDRSTFDSDLQALLASANSRIPAHSLPDLPGTPALPGVPGWHEEELALWNQGEAIRQLVRTARKKLNRTQIAEILDICKTGMPEGEGRALSCSWGKGRMPNMPRRLRRCWVTATWADIASTRCIKWGQRVMTPKLLRS